MQDHLKELLGILYTPGELPILIPSWSIRLRITLSRLGAAEAVAQYSLLFRRPVCFVVKVNQYCAAADREVDRMFHCMFRIPLTDLPLS